MQEYIGEIFEEANQVLLTYYVLKIGKKYGIAVEKTGQNVTEHTAVLGITEKRTEIEMLAQCYLRNEVFPASLIDLVDDYLCDEDSAAC